MKRIICLVLALIFVLCGCSGTLCDDKPTLGIAENENENGNGEELIVDTAKKEEFKGAWLSYSEIAMPKGCRGKSDYIKYMDTVLSNLEKIQINNLFVQVRPFADSIYPSDFYTSSAYVCSKRGQKLEFDYLALIIELCKRHEIKVHAWINPYRIQSTFDETKLCRGELAEKWLKEKNGNVVRIAGGLYFNPASQEVSNLLAEGVSEILENYDVAGIHIDDYFYPDTDEKIDKAQYEAYKKRGGKMTLGDWRRETVSQTVSLLYRTVKRFGKDKLFSISPGGDSEKNKNLLYADTSLWASEDGYCDMIIPQIYYGFENSSKPFNDCCKSWKEMCKAKNVKLVIGLALYKAGKVDEYAGAGRNEWKQNDDIIARQVESIRRIKCDGFCLFSAGFVNFNENSAAKQTQNLLDVLS